MSSPIAGLWRALGRFVLTLLCMVVLLHVFFALRIALLVWINPESSAFMRSEIVRRVQSASPPKRAWSQHWQPLERISPHLQRAVIAAEDDGFSRHTGVEWHAMESAWQRNRQRSEQAQRKGLSAPEKLVGGSTITQQLAKNLLLSGERHLWRKGQELLLTFALEALLDKRRILEIYLNSVEWGDGVFGAEAAAQRYFGVRAHQLKPEQAARLAVMLPAPKLFEQRPDSAYLKRRTALVLGRMSAAVLP
ncbi:MAG: monofunctional biosynthetic peptidoglycan transglycosylase [Pseudomonadota bacterium]|jgi:monofunctional biosynthetic peptidoglycan transglycosylase